MNNESIFGDDYLSDWSTASNADIEGFISLLADSPVMTHQEIPVSQPKQPLMLQSPGQTIMNNYHQQIPNIDQQYNCTYQRRSKLSAQQSEALLKIFHENNRPSALRRQQIAQQFNMTDRQVQIYFQNKRAKARRELRNRAGQPVKVVRPKTPIQTQQIAPKIESFEDMFFMDN